MPVGGGGGSRSGRLARISQSNIRPNGGGSYGFGSSSGIGGQPLAGAEATSPTKKEKDSRHRFEIVRKLGSGTYGKVSLAYDHKFDREVAVKLIKKSAIENKADLVRIRREIRIMSALNHPNIIQIFEVFENKEKIILVMEYASGGELYDYVSKLGSLPESEARRIFRQITSAVLYCHKHKVAHRDLKLENILLDASNNAKIADFGLSNYFSEKSLLNTFCGSPLYASPEIINGTPYRGPEVDCWSLGILLYTLVYGSMPFDGRDFNRMVRQIKRGAYYEPDTPSTASMLIRNMLRVNAERRANIDDIASHWWLNLEENMPVIQELPENQITDHTPLTERAETMVVQDLLDEADVFMEFSHLSSETRRKIEDFRRRRKEAEEYNENCPVKIKARKTDAETEMNANEKSLRGATASQKPEKASDDPLSRLREIESRLGQTPNEKKTAEKSGSLAKKSAVMAAMTSLNERRNSSDLHLPGAATSKWRVETDSLNMLMNQVLEQMEKGPVSLNLVARIKAHPLYEHRPMVKELLESILAGQPETVQKETVKIIEQASQELVRRQSSVDQSTGTAKKAANAQAMAAPDASKTGSKRRAPLEDRQWQSVEVGFDAEEDDASSGRDGMSVSYISNATEETVRAERETTVKPAGEMTSTETQTLTEEDEDDEEEEEYSDAELEELAVEVEQIPDPEPSTKRVPTVTGSEPPVIVSPPLPSASKAAAVSSAASPSAAEAAAAAAAAVAAKNAQLLDAFDRSLIKRQSRGKYQHIIDLYGRGMSLEMESPILPRRRIGGPQPTLEHSPLLFDKARKAIMQYPNKPADLDEDITKKKKKRKERLCVVEVDMGSHDGGSDGTSDNRYANGSVPPRTPPPLSLADEESDEEEESEEEEEDEEFVRPGPPVIGGRIRGIPRTIAEHGSAPIPPRQLNPPPVPPSPPNSLIATTSTEDALKMSSQDVRLPSPGKQSTYMTLAEIDAKRPYATQFGSRSRGESRPVAVVEPNKESSGQHSSPKDIEEENEEVEDGEDSTVLASSGRKNGETAAAYVRRKNRERRRMRNRTIGAPDELIRAADRQSLQESTGEREGRLLRDPLTGALDPFYAHHLGTGGLSNLSGAGSYVRPRYHDDSYRAKALEELERALSPLTVGASRINTAAVVRDDRGKSFHDTSPDRPDYRFGSTYGSSAYGASASPGYTRKFEEPSSLHSWAQEPRRFEVYKTRAERDAERNTQTHGNAPAASPSSYRTSYYTDSRPYSATSTHFTSNYHRPKSTYDESSLVAATSSYTPLHRPSSLYHERSTTPGMGDVPLSLAGDPISVGVTELPPVTSIPRYGRPVTRRTVSALSESERNSYLRSRSMDRKAMELADEYNTGRHSRLATPESTNPPSLPLTEYTYVHYHDTAMNGRASQARGDDKPRGILKNKQSAEIEPRASVGHEGTSGGPVKSVIDRLKRHLSLEKSPPTSPSSSNRAPSVSSQRPYVAPTRLQVAAGGYEDASQKLKRPSAVPFNRRRTSELRLGADGSILTNGYDSSNQYRYHDDTSGSSLLSASSPRRGVDPLAPIDKIKNLFTRGGKDARASSHSGDANGIPTRLGTAYTASGTAYPMTNVATSAAGGYRKFTGAAGSSPTSSHLSRYSGYSAGGGGSGSTGRYLYDDHIHH